MWLTIDCPGGLAIGYENVMPAGSPVAFALLRVPRGNPTPSEKKFRAALAEDRKQLHLSEQNGGDDLQIAGPYQIVVDGTELDEYVVWER